MKVLHKIILAVALLLLGVSLISFRSDSEDLYWYVNGNPYYWESQNDVYAFRPIANSTPQFNFDENIVDRIQSRSDKRDRIILIYFNKNSSDFDRNQVISQIEISNDFDVSFPVITLFPNLTYDKGKWFVVDDQLMAIFNENVIDSNTIRNFEIKYNLLVTNSTGTGQPSNTSYTYIFEIDPVELSYANAIQLSRSIYMEDQQILQNLQPNLINAYEESGTGDIEVVSSIYDTKNSDGITFNLARLSNEHVKIMIESTNQSYMSFNIYDLTGRKLFTKPINKGNLEFNINLSAYPKGLYIANLEGESSETLKQRKFRKL